MEKLRSIITVTLNTAIDRVLEVENFEVGGHLPAEETLRYPAGKGVNVSRALARLGRDSIATGFVGQNESTQFEQVLARTGPGRAVCQLLALRGDTRENITILDPADHTDTHLRTPGYEVTRKHVQRIVSKIGLLSREGTLIVFSGSLPRGMHPADFDTLIYMAMGGGAKVVLDVGGKLMAESTSIDLSVPSEAELSHASQDVPKRLWMIKPNRQELAEALGVDRLEDEAAILDAGRRLAHRVAWVAVTLGAEGALLFHENRVWRAYCGVDPDQITNTVGSGDCLLAGLLDAQVAGLAPGEVLRQGVATATANALRAGVAEFDAPLVAQLAQRTRFEEL